MKLFYTGKDGGPYSTVTGYWLIEAKRLFSIAILKFENGSREEFHSHAFNCLSLVLKGKLREEHKDRTIIKYGPSLKPVITKKSNFHRVFSEGTTWVFTIRGPWNKRWFEYVPKTDEFITLENGRVEVNRRAA